MKDSNILNTGLLAIIAVVLVFGMFQTHRLSVDLDLSQQNNNTISVTGKAETYVTPDTARISFYVTKRGNDQKRIADYVNKKTKSVIEKLESLNIDRKDIKTTNYSLNPEYTWNEGRRNFIGYRAQQNITVTIRDMEIISKVLSTIAELEVDNISGPNMYVDKLNEIKDELREEAIANAKKKARKLADELGVSLDKIVGFSEDGGGYEYARYAKTMVADVAPAGMRVSEPDITPGEEKIVKSVTITFKIQN